MQIQKNRIARSPINNKCTAIDSQKTWELDASPHLTTRQVTPDVPQLPVGEEAGGEKVSPQ